MCIRDSNKSVHLVTTFESAAPVSTVKRYDIIKKCYVDIPCPHAIGTYNKLMGGVDLLDGLISYYRTRIRSKKFYLHLFYILLIWYV